MGAGCKIFAFSLVITINSYGMLPTYTTIPNSHPSTTESRCAPLKKNCKSCITIMRLLVPVFLIFVPAVVGLITNNMACWDNQAHSTEHHQQIGDTIKNLLNILKQ